MSYDGRAVANYVLDVCSVQGRALTNLSLQKIVFFCHAWCLARLKKPLVRHEFEAWDYGPVLQYLYHDFNEYGSLPISSRAVGINPQTGAKEEVRCQFESDVQQLLDEVIGFYGRRTAGELVKLSHVPDGPWFKVWNHKSCLNPGMRIKNADIEAYYSASTLSFTL
jgi:uncharacterized phage-associated protein